LSTDESRTLDEVRIRSLVQRYNSLGDAGRFDEFLELFTDDARYFVGEIEEPYVGREGLRRLLDDARDDLLGWRSDERVHLRHFTSTHVVEFEAADEATGSCYYQALMPHGLDHWGRYVDRYRRTAVGWRFAQRSERRDGMVEGGWCWHLWGPAGVRRIQGGN
jgi:hypothetical protein